MALYQYKALDMKGKVKKGKLDANNQQELYDKLRKDELFMIECEQEYVPVKKKSPMSLKDLSSFCRELGTMLESGMDILSVLDVLIDGAPHKDIKEVLQNVSDSLHDGQSFSDALMEHKQFFPNIMIYMFKAGEANGQLSQVANTLAEQFDKENKIQKKIKTAMIYPTILAIVSIIVVLAIFIVIMPSFSEVFMDVDLPWITQALMKMSQFLVKYSYFVLGFFILFIVVFILLWKQPKVQNAWARYKIKIPKIGRFIQTIYTSRFARSLGSLYISGVNIITALELTASTVNNVYLEQQIKNASMRLKEGQSLSHAIEQVDGLDYKLVRSVSVGEESGKLDIILNSLSDEYDADATQAIEKLLALMEPVLILFLGLVVGIIVIAVLLPIYSMYSSF